MLAGALGYRYLDTGALYRGVAYAAREAGITSRDDEGLERLCRTIRLRFDADRLMLDDADITHRIRSPEVTMLASAVSARPVVRRALLQIQRRIGGAGGVVAEGRDMGTVVFPRADVKFFLDASLKQRARRRFDQYGDDGPQTLQEIERDIRRRDEDDRTREAAPLKPAVDAVVLDSSRMTAKAVVDRMRAHIRAAGAAESEQTPGSTP
jgi:cytidylate kinase